MLSAEIFTQNAECEKKNIKYSLDFALRVIKILQT